MQQDVMITCYLMTKILYFNFLLKEECTHTWKISISSHPNAVREFTVHKNCGESIER